MNLDDMDDTFDFDDDGFDDLPADALQELEYTAIRATQHQNKGNIANEESEEGEYEDGEDDEEIVDLRDQPAAIDHYVHQLRQQQQQSQPPQQQSAYDYEHGLQTDAMDVDEPPARSQADAPQLLLRIKKVPLPANLTAVYIVLTDAARARESQTEQRAPE